MRDIVQQALSDSAKTALSIGNDLELRGRILQAAQFALSALKRGGKLLFAGNGGSAAEAQHMAAEYVGRYKFARPALPAIALTTDTSILTAVGNDYGYDFVFARQIEAIGRKGDLLFLSSTSGRSRNILQAIVSARRLEISTVLLTGADYDTGVDEPDLVLVVPSKETARIQEAHLIIGHAICDFVEQHMFGT